MISRFPFCLAAAAALLAFIPVPLHADDNEAVVRVVIEAPSDVRVEIALASRDDPGLTWTRVVNGGESATFASVPPGRYDVRLVPAGSQPVSLELDLQPARTLVLAGTFPAGASLPTLSVSADLLRSQHTAFGAEEHRALPSSGSLWALVDTAAPFTIVDRMDAGGLATGMFPRFGAHGSSWTNTSLTFGDVTLPYPMKDGALPVYPDMGAAASVVVASGLAPVEAATGFVRLALEPRRPGRQFSGAIDASFSAPRMVSVTATDVAPAIERLHSWQHVAVQAGGPISPATGLFVSTSLARARGETRDVLEPHANSAATLFAHLVSRVGSGNELRVLAAAQRVQRPFAGRTQFAGRDAMEIDAFSQVRATWSRQGAGGWHQWVSAGLERAAFDPDVAGLTGGTLDRVFDGVVPDVASSSTWSQMGARARLTSGDLRVGRATHRLHVGVSASRASIASDVLAAPPVAELVDGIPARVWLTGLPGVSASHSVTDIAVHASDDIAPTSRLSFSLGARLNWSTGRGGAGASDIRWVTASPRLSFTWAPSRAFSLLGGFHRYHHPLRTDIPAFGAAGEPLREVHRWTDTDGDAVFDADELGPLVLLSGRHPDITSVDADLRAPYTDALSVTASTALGRRSNLRLTATVRRDRDLLRLVNTLPNASYTLRFVPDLATDVLQAGVLLPVFDRNPESFGQDRYVLTNAPPEDAYHEGLDLEWDLRTARWYSMAGVTAYRSVGPSGDRGFRAAENDQGVIGELGGSPNAATFSHGRLFFDRAYVLKWSTSFQSANGVLAAFSARYQDGQPFSRLVVVPDLAQGAEAISADEPGSTRFTFTVTLDARFEKRFALRRGAFAVRLDVFNLTNHANEVEEHVLGGPRFREITAVQPPRVLRLGARWEF